ncbi:hypothetical protein ACM46_13305 [Chryseobacterium angstadtii]|uniref:Cytochrome P450 n=1 Tax=Chryseobacterium angstadtii TaxID=558151 RepID=A0A0J7IGP1_9FLAO|nr:cytochrome P450 [Chryseobacterium angstadtii]KMQ65154.1 hypothetical protein ACM46_13305 [Chryseobacterium angstadtii]
MSDIDFDSIEFATDPDSILSGLRKENGLYPYQFPDGPKVWLVTRRKEVEEVLTSANVFQVSPATKEQSYKNNPFSEAIPKPMHLLATDGFQHKKLREPLEKFFTIEILENYRQYITDEVKKLLSGWKKGESIDLAKNFSYPIPVKVIAKMLGLKWNEHFPQYAISLQMVKTYPEDHLKNVVTFHQIIKETIEHKRIYNQGTDIISVLLNAGLTDEEVLSVSLLLFIAGSGTTASLIIQGLREIINSGNAPDHQLTDKILFRTPPANSAFPRYVHAEYELSGTKLYQGDLLIVILASANYDFKDSDDPLKSYFSFSKGIHHCIGWYIAKMEAEIAFEEFYRFFPKSKILSEEWFSNVLSRDIVSMKVELG